MISCLCVTHERPEFMPWVEHQFRKQSATFRVDGELIIIDSSEKPWVPQSDDVIVIPSKHRGIAEKRTEALSWSSGDIITWFDDDDWQSPTKLGCAWLFSKRVRYDAVGSSHAEMYSCVQGLSSKYESRYEPLIFNSALYRKSAVPETFDASRITGEDTDWQMRFFARHPNFITLGEPMHAWLCHGKNITNKANSRFFDRQSKVPFDAWELDFLKRMQEGKL